jgi:hypothetical protein
VPAPAGVTPALSGHVRVVTEKRRLERRIQRRIRRSTDSTRDGVRVVADIAADVSAHVVVNRGGSSAAATQQRDAGRPAPAEEEKP